MKANSIIRIVIYGIVAALLCGILAAGMGLGHFVFDLGDSSGDYITGSGSIPVENIENLQIEWVSGSVDVTIVPDTESNITFSEIGGTEDCAMVYEVKGRTLIIRYEKPHVQIGFGNWSTPDKALTVEIPAYWYLQSIDISSVSADVDVLQLKSGDVDIENVSGSTEVHIQEAGDVDIETVSGPATFIGACEKLNMNSVSGDCDVFLDGATKEIRFEGVSGDLKVSVFKEQGFTARLDSISGNIYSSFSTSVSGGAHSYGDGSMRITADTVSGDIQILESRIELTDRCSHVWDGGDLRTVPGDTRQEMVYTCLVCGSTKSEPLIDTKD